MSSTVLEDVARIIDPEPWAQVDRWYVHGERVNVDRSIVKPSVDKARAILSLIPTRDEAALPEPVAWRWRHTPKTYGHECVTPGPWNEGKPPPHFPGEAWQFETQPLYAALPPPPVGGQAGTFQERVQPWMMACFGPEIAADRLERNDRFLEEALELVQASDYPAERAHALVEYVYGRPQGDINQEVGGVMITLAAHCLAHGVDMHAAGETELARIWTKVEQIRAKQAAKPKGSALPIAQPTDREGGR